MGKRTRPCEREKNLSGLRQVSFNLLIMASARFTASLMLTRTMVLPAKRSSKLDADIFGQNHHISARHIFRSQFIFQTN
ncbi:Uncharacterised protein [Escherichia coli]|uniref:Uncharacterized protein n=1 Tax=Escherichia coli TaxID=562 RepID=A0A2X3KIG0_ECOLX|nr:Uncharacterised protein [Escherichia coli]